MKISININESIADTELVINSNSFTPEIERIIAALRMLDSQITVSKNGVSYILDVAKIAVCNVAVHSSASHVVIIYTKKYRPTVRANDNQTVIFILPEE